MQFQGKYGTKAFCRAVVYESGSNKGFSEEIILEMVTVKCFP